MGRTANTKQNSYKDEWTSVWLNHYSQPGMSRKTTSPHSEDGSTSSSLLSANEYLFSPPTPDPPRSPSPRPTPYPRSKPPSKTDSRAPTPPSSGGTKARPIPQSPPVKPLSIKKRQHVPAPLKLQHSALDVVVPQLESSPDPAKRALPVVPKDNTSQQKRVDEVSKGQLGRSDSKRRRPVPVILSPDINSEASKANQGLIVLTPTWTASLKNIEQSPANSPPLHTPSPSFLQVPSPQVVIQRDGSPEKRFDIIATSPTRIVLSPVFPPASYPPSAKTPVSAKLRMKQRKPAQEIPSSALNYEQRLLDSEADNFSEFGEVDSTADDESDVVPPLEGYYELEGLDLGFDWDTEIDIELDEIQAAHRGMFDFQRTSMVNVPWRLVQT